MVPLKNDSCAFGVKGFDEEVHDVFGELLLNGEPMTEMVHRTGELGKTQEAGFRNISEVRLAEEGKHVMRTQTVEGDVLTNNHLVDINVLEDRRIETVTASQLQPRPGCSNGSLCRVGRLFRSEERRVGEECRYRWSTCRQKK